MAQMLTAHQTKRFQRRRLEMQAVGDHQLGAGLVGSGLDGLAIRLADFHRLFQQHVQPGLQRRDRELPMTPIGGREIDGVESARLDRGLPGVIVIQPLDPVAAPERLRLVTVARDQCRDLRVSGVFYAGHKRGLADPARSHHGVADFPILDLHCHLACSCSRTGARLGSQGCVAGVRSAASQAPGMIASAGRVPALNASN